MIEQLGAESVPFSPTLYASTFVFRLIQQCFSTVLFQLFPKKEGRGKRKQSKLKEKNTQTIYSKIVTSRQTFTEYLEIFMLVSLFDFSRNILFLKKIQINSKKYPSIIKLVTLKYIKWTGKEIYIEKENKEKYFTTAFFFN